MKVVPRKEAINLPNGLIIKGVGGLYTVINNNKQYFCKARGLFRKDSIKPLPGDYVQYKVLCEETKEGIITEIHERKNNLIRPMVANIDQAIIVISVKEPSPDLLLLDKLICACESKGIVPIICINKIDLVDEEDVNNILKQYIKTQYSIITTSVKSGIHLDKLKKLLNDKKTVFAGQSGVGKSSILNYILNEYIMEIGELSIKLGRGKHTTRHTQFIPIQKGFLIDTPGFSNFDSGLLEEKDIKYYYKEFNQYEDTCRFNGCIHINEPGCTVKEAVKSGTIDINRYKRYIDIYNLVKKAKKDKRGY